MLWIHRPNSRIHVSLYFAFREKFILLKTKALCWLFGVHLSIIMVYVLTFGYRSCNMEKSQRSERKVYSNSPISCQGGR